MKTSVAALQLRKIQDRKWFVEPYYDELVIACEVQQHDGRHYRFGLYVPPMADRAWIVEAISRISGNMDRRQHITR